MIAISKETGSLFENAKFHTGGKIFISVKTNSDLGAYLEQDQFNIYLDESEVQQRIEAAVTEHKLTVLENESLYEHLRDKVKQLEEANHKLLANIGDWKLKCDRLEEEKEELNECIAELEAPQQLVEVPAELAEGIETLRSKGWSNQNIIFHSAYPQESLTGNDDQKIIDSCLLINKEAWKSAEDNPVDIIGALLYGYTIKPDPLHDRIRGILERHDDDESFEPAVSALMELLSSVKQSQE